jgi:hypothetical protein
VEYTDFTTPRRGPVELNGEARSAFLKAVGEPPEFVLMEPPPIPVLPLGVFVVTHASGTKTKYDYLGGNVALPPEYDNESSMLKILYWPAAIFEKWHEQRTANGFLDFDRSE